MYSQKYVSNKRLVENLDEDNSTYQLNKSY